MSSRKASAKKQKTSDATSTNSDGPTEDDKTAREKLKAAGFDPDDVHTARSNLELPSAELYGNNWFNITPMAYFACNGDLSMCRYLHHVRGAVTTKAAQEHRTRPDEPVIWYPIYAAAYESQFDTVKWLYQNGSKSEILKVDKGGSSAISTGFYAQKGRAPLRKGAVDFAKWLILEGVLEGGGVAANSRRLCHFLYELQHENTFWELQDMPGLFIGWMDEKDWKR